MKKLIFAIALMLPMVTQGASIQTIEAGWTTKVITHVSSGSLGTMLQRFNETWPTPSVGEAVQAIRSGYANQDPEAGRIVINDARNGYIRVYDEDARSENQYMSACVWNRSNKHRLLAVVIGQPYVPGKEIICFYDYDPQKQTLTPESAILSGWKPRFSNSFVAYRLPRVGKELLIVEQQAYEELCTHHFRWSGMRPVFDFTDPEKGSKLEGSFPGGLDDDGRGPEETEPYGVPVKFDGEEYVRVFTAEQFVNALKSNAMILVAKDTEINLTPLLDDASHFRTRFKQWRPEGSTEVGDMEALISEEVSDGRQLTICNHKRMTIRGEGNSRLVVEPRYAFCLNFKDCEQIEIHNLTIGHTTGGYCQGGVIGVQGGWRVNLHGCDLYGCGTYGLELNSTRDFSMYRSIIHDCTYGIMTLQNVEFAKFEQCDFRNNREFTLVESRGSNVQFNECRFYANAGDAQLFGFDREFFMQGCIVCHPTESLGTINLADQSGAKNWFDPNPLNSNLPTRAIGPDQR
ncbi:MAG: right-handed parallel beta-helix repeat-containing protein [Prevotella sp.]|nr:right-handed parallel beta-helix repeat-containing protein [Prevotella sp.]